MAGRPSHHSHSERLKLLQISLSVNTIHHVIHKGVPVMMNTRRLGRDTVKTVTRVPLFHRIRSLQHLSVLTMRAAVLSETSADLYQTTRRHIPENINFMQLILTVRHVHRLVALPRSRTDAARSQHANCTPRHATVLHISATQTNWLRSVIGFPGQQFLTAAWRLSAVGRSASWWWIYEICTGAAVGGSEGGGSGSAQRPDPAAHGT